PATDSFLQDYFAREVFPVLTPIAIDPGHPFPHLRNKSLNLAVRFGGAGPAARLRYGLVPVPAVLPRLVELPDGDGRRSYLLLEDVIARHVVQLFPGMPIEGTYPFKVTRNWDLTIVEGPMNLPDLAAVLGRIDSKELHNEAYTPVHPAGLGETD